MKNETKTTNTVDARREIIKNHFSNLKGKSIECPALGKDVEITTESIRETAAKASKREKSTLAALQIEVAIKKAKYVDTHIPKKGKQTKIRFVKIHELKAFLKGIGEVKIMVGERRNTRVLHYCITAK